MDETIYVILKLLFDFALEVWFSIFLENRLPADNSHEISSLLVIFEKAAKFEIVVCCKL